MKKSKLSKYIILGAIAALVATFILPKKEIRKGHPRDYAEIAADGTLHAATEYNSISFYVDGDTLSGFHYELIEAFARDHGLQVAITPEMSFNERLEGLANGRFDVIAYGILATSEIKGLLASDLSDCSEQAGIGTTENRLSRRFPVYQKPIGLSGKDAECGRRVAFHPAHP